MSNTQFLGTKETAKGTFSFYCLTCPVDPEWKDKVEFFIQESKTDDWKADIHHRLNGDYAAWSEDRFYIAADAGGNLAAILWSGLCLKSGKGNFGHVFTAHRFRKLGLLNQLMEYFTAEYHSGAGRVLCCICGRPGPLKCYMAYDFEMILGRPGPLALVRKGQSCTTFAGLEEHDYADTGVALIRPGTPGEQFDFDKFLAYSNAMLTAPAYCWSRGPMTLLYWDYRQVYLTTFQGGTVSVAENKAGHVLGFAFAAPQQKNSVSAWLDFTMHPAAFAQSPQMIRDAAERFQGNVFAGFSSADTQKLECLKNAGFEEATRLPLYFGKDDLVILKFKK